MINNIVTQILQVIFFFFLARREQVVHSYHMKLLIIFERSQELSMNDLQMPSLKSLKKNKIRGWWIETSTCNRPSSCFCPLPIYWQLSFYFLFCILCWISSSLWSSLYCCTEMENVKMTAAHWQPVTLQPYNQTGAWLRRPTSMYHISVSLTDIIKYITLRPPPRIHFKKQYVRMETDRI